MSNLMPRIEDPVRPSCRSPGSEEDSEDAEEKIQHWVAEFIVDVSCFETL